MSKWPIKHPCGHEYVYNLVGRLKAREYRAARLSEEYCADCRREGAIQRSRIQGAAARDELDARDVALPALTGSEKQVAWANDLRAKHLLALERIVFNDLPPMGRPLQTLLLGLHPICVVSGSADVIEALVTAARTRVEARWWIDRARRSTGELVPALAWAAVMTPDPAPETRGDEEPEAERLALFDREPQPARARFARGPREALAEACARCLAEYADQCGGEDPLLDRDAIADAIHDWHATGQAVWKESERRALAAFLLAFYGGLRAMLDAPLAEQLLPLPEHMQKIQAVLA